MFGMCSTAVLAGAGCTPQTVIQNASPALNAPTHGITVSGIGKANGTPDIVRVTVGVEVRAATAEQAIAEANARIANVIAAVKQAGLADKDVRTATLTLNFERAYDQPVPVEPAPTALPKARPTGEKGADKQSAQQEPAPALVKLPRGFYNAINNLDLTIRQLDAAGKVISAATNAGADQIYGIRFDLDDPSALQIDARKKAVEDARQRAERLAQLASVKLGPAISITETDNGVSGPMPAYAMMKSANVAPVEGGELTLTSSVQIVYALGE
jgi:uncharacterized protein